MDAQRFEIGQAVTLKVKLKGIIDPNVSMVKHGEIYTVAEYHTNHNDWFITLNEMPATDGFSERIFDPVDITNEQIAELVEESLTEKV